MPLLCCHDCKSRHIGCHIDCEKYIREKREHRYYCTNEENPYVSWHNGFVAKIYNEMYPLTLPYMPNSRPDVIVCDELLTDRKNGDYDTLAILYIKKADGERVEVNRYFKENEVSFTEISPEEYKERQRLQEERIKSEDESKAGRK